MSRGIGNRPSLGYPGDKYEMGLEAIEEIEVIAAELAALIAEGLRANDPATVAPRTAAFRRSFDAFHYINR